MIRLSRLAKREEKRNIRLAVLYGGLTLGIIIAIIFVGIPAFVKMTIFLGNLKSSSPISENGKIIPIAPPRLNTLPEATNSAQIAVTGFGAANTPLTLFLNGTEAEKLEANDDGSFEFKNVSLDNGDNEIYVSSADKDGKNKAISDRVIITYETTPPDLEINNPQDGTTITSLDNHVEIVGKASKDNILTVNDHLVVVDSDGDFRYLLDLTTGGNPIKVVATDQAGNKTEKNLTVNYSP